MMNDDDVEVMNLEDETQTMMLDDDDGDDDDGDEVNFDRMKKAGVFDLPAMFHR